MDVVRIYIPNGRSRRESPDRPSSIIQIPASVGCPDLVRGSLSLLSIPWISLFFYSFLFMARAMVTIILLGVAGAYAAAATPATVSPPATPLANSFGDVVASTASSYAAVGTVGFLFKFPGQLIGRNPLGAAAAAALGTANRWGRISAGFAGGRAAGQVVRKADDGAFQQVFHFDGAWVHGDAWRVRISSWQPSVRLPVLCWAVQQLQALWQRCPAKLPCLLASRFASRCCPPSRLRTVRRRSHSVTCPPTPKRELDKGMQGVTLVTLHAFAPLARER